LCEAEWHRIAGIGSVHVQTVILHAERIILLIIRNGLLNIDWTAYP